MAPTNAEFFGYTPDSVTIKVSFPSTGFEPLSYIVAFNSFGCQNTGNWPNDRRSIVLPNLVTPYLTGGYLVFLNPPDAAVYPASSLPIPPVLLDPVISGCPPGPFNIRFHAPQAGDYWLLFDLNGDSGLPGQHLRLLDRARQPVTGNHHLFLERERRAWQPVPANTTFPITFSFRKGRINIPIYDDELNVYGFNVAGYLAGWRRIRQSDPLLERYPDCQ